MRVSIQLSTILVFGTIVATLGALVGRRWGSLHGRVWAWIHGADRTRRASALIAAGIGLEAALLSGGALALLHGLARLLAPIALAAGVAGAWWALREWQPAPEPSPARPASATELHDGLVFSLPSRAAWVSALLTVLAIALPVPMVVPALWWSRRASATRVRLRGDELELARGGRRAVVPLLFAPIEEDTRWDGTPVIRVGGAEIPVGGGPPGEVAWAIERLRTASIEADPVGSPAPPEALRRLRVAAREG